MATQTIVVYASADDQSRAEWVYDDVMLLATGLHVVTGTAPLLVYFDFNGQTHTNSFPPGTDTVVPLSSALSRITRPVNPITGNTGIAIAGLTGYGFGVGASLFAVSAQAV